jgi:hypothetical protein
VRQVTDAERRARIAVRHGLHPDHRYPDAVAATRAMTVLHATEAASVHLSLWARVAEPTVAGFEDSLYLRRELVKQLAMRRTLFVADRALLPALWGSASARVAGAEFRRLAADVAKAGLAVDSAAWVEVAAAEVLARLADGDELSASDLRAQVPVLGSLIVFGSGRWAQQGAVGPRVLTLLGARGQLVRGRNAGHWRISRPLWTSTAAWLGQPPVALPEPEGYAALVRRWLSTFGPGTEDDIVWWLGATRAAVRAALADVAAVAVRLEDGRPAWLLPDDLDPVGSVSPWAALLPALDPTTMGWKGRGHYLDPADAPYLFDTAGNGGSTAWWNGRIVGAWAQREDGSVQVVLRGDPGRQARAALDAEAARLTEWLDGQLVGSIYSAPMLRGQPLP